MTWYKSVIYLLAICLFSSCSIGKSGLKKSDLNNKSYFPYDFATSKLLGLAPELKEISGLCYDAESEQLMAIQDELGIIYTIDKASGKILKKDTFHKGGDYEGVAMTDKYIFVVKSTGTIYKVDKSAIGEKPAKIKSFLSKEYDIEGVEYDAASNSLLLCSKNFISEDTKNQRFIYQYDLAENKMMEEAFLTIDRNEILTYLKENFSAEYIGDKFKKIINPDLDYLHLGPSAVGIHPITKDIYILSSKSKVLLVYDGRSKALSFIQKLDKTLCEQPEGICFDPLGNMYVSNEGKKRPAQLMIMPVKASKVMTKR